MSDFQHLTITPDDVWNYVLNYQYGDNACGENNQFNCWGLLREIQQKFFGINLPITSLGDPIAQLYSNKMKSGAWMVVDQPFHGCGVLMRDGRDPHCGVWLDFDGGGVLHCERGNGVLWQREQDLRLSCYANLKFYRFDNEKSSNCIT